MSRFKRISKRVGIVLAGLVLLVSVVWTVLNVVFSIQLNNTLKKIKAQGKPLTWEELKPPAIPDEENAATFYNQAFVLMTTGEGGEQYQPNKSGGKLNKKFEYISNFLTSPEPSDWQWTSEERGKISNIIYSPEFRKIYELIEEGSQRKGCNFDLEYEKGIGMCLPHLKIIRDVTRLIVVKARVESQSGRLDEAYHTLMVGFRFSNHLKDESTILISQLVRVACDTMLLRSLENITCLYGVTSEGASGVIKELNAHSYFVPSIKYLDGERVMGRMIFNDIIHCKYPVEELFDVGGKRKSIWLFIPRPIKKVLIILWRPILKKDLVCHQNLLLEMERYLGQPYYLSYPEMKKIPERIPKYCFYSRMLVPALEKCQINITRVQALTDLCRVGLALKIYKSRHSYYPERLDRLVPDILTEVPLDPFIGKDLIYRKTGNGFILYSLGENLKDDGGLKTKKFEGDYDIVWKCNQ